MDGNGQLYRYRCGTYTKANDYGTDKNNPDIDYPGETDAQHDPL